MYKSLNTNTNKIMESANVNFDEYTEVHDDEPIKRPEEYQSFVYFYKGMLLVSYWFWKLSVNTLNQFQVDVEYTIHVEL